MSIWNYVKHHRHEDRTGGGGKRKRVTKGLQSQRRGKSKHYYIVQRPSKENTRQHEELLRNGRKATREGDKRRLTLCVRK
jgi:hypothetical protein